MKIAAIVSLALCALPAGSMADKPKVTRTMVEAMEKSVDGRLQNLFAPDSAAGDKLRSQVFRDQMEQIGKRGWIAGALMWCYQDYKSHRNLWPGETAGYVDHGVVDEYRQRRPSYYVWKELNSPAHVNLEWKYGLQRVPVGFRAGIERRLPDEIPSYDLRDYRLVWELRDDDNSKLAGGEKSLPDIGPPAALEANWTAASTKSLRLILKLYRPTGFIAAEKTLTWWALRPGGLNLEEMKRQGILLPE